SDEEEETSSIESPSGSKDESSSRYEMEVEISSEFSPTIVGSTMDSFEEDRWIFYVEKVDNLTKIITDGNIKIVFDIEKDLKK
ncbi:hypothetical protein KI387_006623, partial [Taxus chinensis]